MSIAPQIPPSPLRPLRQGLIQAGMLLGLLVLAPAGCAEGIVLDPPKPFAQREIILPTPEPSPNPSPSTRLQKIQVRFIEVSKKADAYRGYAWPILIGLALLAGFTQLIRWIYDLTTSSPSLF